MPGASRNVHSSVCPRSTSIGAVPAGHDRGLTPYVSVADGILRRAERDLLRAVPEGEAAELRQLLRALDDRREVVRPQLAGLRGEVAVAVRHQQLGLALPARIQRELAGMRVRGGVLCADAEVAVAPRDPVRLAAPAAMDDAIVEREAPLECRARPRRQLLLPARDEAHAGCHDLEHARNVPQGFSTSAVATMPAAARSRIGHTFNPRWRRLK